jgi:homoserine dehydrogenase
MPAAAEVVPSTAPQSAARTIRLGILGLGQVGQAVARVASGNARLKETGLGFRIAGALVRDIDRVRRCPRPSRLTTDPAAFLRGQYDVVVEALGTIEPARTIICRLLSRGIPVVTANKALVAACGQELSELAARHGTTLRYEASALAGVPFLGALAARPLVSDVEQFLAVVNGTSNFILSRLEADRATFADALMHAQSLGLTEPDPSRDLDGLDAADKLSLLASVFGWGNIPADRIDVQGIAGLTSQDLVVARSIDATIKPVVWARRSPAGISAFVGPVLVPSRHPVAALADTLCGIQLSGRYVPDLFFSGPGAGPDVTAATIVDDAVEAVSTLPQVGVTRTRHAPPTSIGSPDTDWFVSARFPGVVPDQSAATHIFRSQNLDVTVVSAVGGDALWVRVRRASRRQMNDAVTGLARTHRVQCRAMRSLVP